MTKPTIASLVDGATEVLPPIRPNISDMEMMTSILYIRRAACFSVLGPVPGILLEKMRESAR